MTPETHAFLTTLRAPRRIHWTPLAVAEAAACLALIVFWLGLGWWVMSAWYH